MGAPLLAHLGKLTTNPSTLQEFRHWFSNALWDVESGVDGASDDITDLFYAVENMLGIYDAGFWTIDELVAALHEAVDTPGLAPLAQT